MLKIFPLPCGIFLFFSIFSASSALAQTRKTVGAAEATGAFRNYFSGKARGSFDEIKIQSIGKGKLKVSFDLTYPHRDASGKMTANMGTGQGIAAITGDTAIYSSDEFGKCRITIKFVKPGQIKVTQSGSDSDCGFGFNVTADGTYRKVSGAKPKFENTK